MLPMIDENWRLVYKPNQNIVAISSRNSELFHCQSFERNHLCPIIARLEMNPDALITMSYHCVSARNIICCNKSLNIYNLKTGIEMVQLTNIFSRCAG